MSDKSFNLSVKVIILDDESRCLLLRRSKSSRGNPGKWDFPGGKADPGETFQQALLREVQEETGLIISLRRVVGAAESAVPNRRVAYLIMEASANRGEVRLSEEHDDHAWVPIADLSNWDLAPQFQGFATRYASVSPLA